MPLVPTRIIRTLQCNWPRTERNLWKSMVISIGIRRVHELRREEKGKLAAATTGDARVRGLIDESFVGAYGGVVDGGGAFGGERFDCGGVDRREAGPRQVMIATKLQGRDDHLCPAMSDLDLTVTCLFVEDAAAQSASQSEGARTEQQESARLRCCSNDDLGGSERFFQREIGAPPICCKRRDEVNRTRCPGTINASEKRIRTAVAGAITAVAGCAEGIDSIALETEDIGG
jgi:hypothetical protein